MSRSSSATRRKCGRITVLPSTTRIAGRSSSAEAAAPGVRGVRPVGRDPLRRDLVAVEEAPQLGADVPAMPDDDRARRQRLGRDALQPARPGHPVGRQPADLLGDVGDHGRDRVVVVRLDQHHARRLPLRGSSPGTRSRARAGPRRRRRRGDARRRRALSDTVEALDRLDTSFEEREQRALAALGRRVLTGHEATSAATRESRSVSAASSDANSAIRPISSVVTTCGILQGRLGTATE